MMLHAIAAQVIVFALPAVAVGAAARRWPRQAQAAWLGLAALTLATAALTYRDYFQRWEDGKDTRAAYFANFGAVTQFLRQSAYQGNVTLSTPFPNLPHDPFVADLRVRRADLDLTWFDARQALVFPPDAESLLVLPANAPLDPLLAEPLSLAGAERHLVRAGDVDPHFDTLLWNPSGTLEAWLAEASWTRLDPPSEFGGAIALIAYRIGAAEARPGDAVALLTLWRVRDPARLGPVAPTHYGREAMLFVHVLDPAGSYVAGQDQLGAPAWDWRPGSVFAQVHRPALPAGLAPGDYRFVVGLYTLPWQERVPLIGPAGVSLGDNLELGSVRVAP
jgi:hypothetical protein